jgi:hypothetical protein
VQKISDKAGKLGSTAGIDTDSGEEVFEREIINTQGEKWDIDD